MVSSITRCEHVGNGEQEQFIIKCDKVNCQINCNTYSTEFRLVYVRHYGMRYKVCTVYNKETYRNIIF